jgi:hypothetical protein
MSVPTLVVEVPVEGRAVAWLDCRGESDEERLVLELAQRDIVGDLIDAVERLFDGQCDGEAS